jgi:hypothetical protein
MSLCLAVSAPATKTLRSLGRNVIKLSLSSSPTRDCNTTRGWSRRRNGARSNHCRMSIFFRRMHGRF